MLKGEKNKGNKKKKRLGKFMKILSLFCWDTRILLAPWLTKILQESKSWIHRGAAWIKATTEAVNGPDFFGNQHMPMGRP